MSFFPLLISTYFLLYPTPLGNQIPSVLVDIAQCESHIEQFTDSGEPKWSPTNDVGIMQINAVNIPTAKHMGLDVVHSPSDNITFGIWLYTQRGTTPWNGSKDCWGKGVT